VGGFPEGRNAGTAFLDGDCGADVDVSDVLGVARPELSRDPNGNAFDGKEVPESIALSR